MADVARLVTLVDIDERVTDAHQMSLSARHEAVLVDGRRVLLLDDRGWSSSARGDVRREDLHDLWAGTSVDDIEDTARVVVGPDEPFGRRSQEDMERDHWVYLIEILRQHGVLLDTSELTRLQHDVVLSERLRARLS